MDLAQYVDRLHHELMVAAEAGGDEALALAERLTAPLESAVRLTILSVLSAAASEITSELAPGSVDVRLRGLDPEFVVTPAPTGEHREEADEPSFGTASSTAPTASADAEEGTPARMTLRLPEPFKLRIEEAAGREQLSVNTWLVRTLAAALEQSEPGRRSRRPDTSGERQRYTGWVQ